MNQIRFKKISTPIGNIVLAATNKGICWVGGEQRFYQPNIWIQKVSDTFKLFEDNNYPLLKEAEKQLSFYFKGDLKNFELPFELFGTDFQKKVWLSIADISFGQTTTYTKLAFSVKNPSATRAIGTICGLNPLIIVIPCHRVVGSNGKLTGFVEGIETKQFLLNLEKPAIQAKLF